MDTPATTDTEKARTLWRRLHRSSYIFTGGLAVILLLVNIPGQIVVGPDISSRGKYGPHFDADERAELPHRQMKNRSRYCKAPSTA